MNTLERLYKDMLKKYEKLKNPDNEEYFKIEAFSMLLIADSFLKPVQSYSVIVRNEKHVNTYVKSVMNTRKTTIDDVKNEIYDCKKQFQTEFGKDGVIVEIDYSIKSLIEKYNIQ